MKETYNTIKKADDKNKRDVNKLLYNLGKEHNRYKHQAIVLDTELLKTAKSLRDAGFLIPNIHIPNPYNFEKIRRETETAYDMLLGDFIEEQRRGLRNRVSMSFFDYCCSLDGNSDMKPIEDIKQFFNYQLPRDDSILAVTLCWRNVNKQGKSQYSDMMRLISIVTHEAYINGYVAIVEPTGKSYKGGMFYVVFKLFQL